MNTNYVNGFKMEQKYRNRTKQDSDQDPEWAKYKEEKQNSKKMSTILRSLNGNQKKRRPLVPSDSMTSANLRGNAQSVNTMRKNTETPFSGKIRPLKEAAEGDEVSNL